MALEEAVTDTVIYFLTESYSLGSKDKAKLDKLAELFLKVPGSSLALLGHTDPYGNADYNRKLSKKRCDSVKDYLIESGINSLLLEVIEKGETETNYLGSTARNKSPGLIPTVCESYFHTIYFLFLYSHQCVCWIFIYSK